MPTKPAPKLDLERFRFEARLAIEARGDMIVEQLPPGLSVALDVDAGEVIVLSEGVDVGRIPLYRLFDVDKAMLTTVVAEILADIDDAAVAQDIGARIDAGLLTYHAPPGSDWVTLVVDAQPFAKIHRCRVCPGWPDEPTESLR